MKSVYTTGQLANKTSCKVETVLYYEKAGLMPQPPRSGGGHRAYDLTHVKRLNFIRRSRELGFSIKQIKDLLKFIDEPNHYCGEIKAMATLHTIEIQKKIDDLEQLKTALDLMVNQCKGGQTSMKNCPIIDSLYNE